jgi:preflagellin peptidase FlaK
LDYVLIRILIASIMLGTAAYFDLKSRRVSDRMWIIFAAIACIIYIFDPPADVQVLYLVVSALFTATLCGLAYKVGLFGGADVFALILVSILVPTNANYFHIIGEPILQLPITSLNILLDALILSMSQIVINVVHNLRYLQRSPNKLFEGFEHENRFHKVFAVLVGQKKTHDSVKYGFTIERSISATKFFDFSIKNAEHQEFASVEDGAWVSSATPFLAYICVAFVLVALGVDPISLISRLIVSR